jgi:hypothetical protein
LRTKEVLRLALERGEITSKDVVCNLSEGAENPKAYRNLLAQAATILSRLHERGELEREWIRENRGCFSYRPSDKTVDSLLPVLGILEERKKRKQIEETLSKITKRLILELRLDEQVKAILWDSENFKADRTVEIYIITDSLEVEDLINNEVGSFQVDATKFKPVFVGPKDPVSDKTILYGWGYLFRESSKE